MTTEVAIINSQAVALAADSAVTIAGEKVYNSALKLFSLSKIAPVGIMIFNGASLIDCSWETLIKVYRERLGDKSFAKAHEYAVDFFRFIEDEFHTLSPASEEKSVFIGLDILIHEMKNAQKEEVDRLLDGGTQLDLGTTLEVLEKIFKDFNEAALGTEASVSNRDGAILTLKDRYGEKICRIIQEKFSSVSFSQKDLDDFLHAFSLNQTSDVFGQRYTGLVFAGFGDEEIYPSVFTYNIGGIVSGQIRKVLDQGRSKNLNEGINSTIIPFAQSDMIQTFITGMAPDIHIAVNTFVEESISAVIEHSVENNANPESKAKLMGAEEKLKSQFGSKFNKFIYGNFVNPVLDMVSSLPKEELAEMAETLVNLTAFKRRMTNQLESVGGPVDVAIISKGDGLVWVKRKHYFPAELNQHFYQNYFRGMSDETKSQ